MALTKPPVLPPWADSGDKVQPSDVEIQAGWPLSNVPPSRQRFNWLLNFLSNGIRYLTRRGMPDYDATETYMTGDRVIGDDGKTYRSVIDNNIAHTPSTSPTQWERWGYSAAELGDALNASKATFIVRAASTAAINLAAPGAAIDGVTMVAGDRFLEKDNGTGASRGIYVWNGAAVAATRATDADTGAELKAGILVEVTEGATNADTVWMLTTDGAITIGVTSLTFSPMARVISTPAQYDNSTKLSTTAFVKRALGSCSGYTVINADTTLTAAHAGNLIIGTGSGSNVTLPVASTLQDGDTFYVSAGSIGLTLLRQGADLISPYLGSAQSSLTSYVLAPAQGCVLMKAGSGFVVVSNTGMASIAASGYQKLPSGLIVQWGTTPASSSSAAVSTTFPIAFPTTRASLILGSGGVAAAYIMGLDSASLSGFTSSVWSTAGARVAGNSCYFIAIGY